MSVSPTDERRILQLVEAALNLPEEQRLVFLETRLSNQHALQTRAINLLFTVTNLSESTDDVFALDVPEVEEIEVKKLITGEVGAYRIIEPLGAGGMGRVYLAERSDGAFDKQVAIKVMQSERYGALFTERFEAERQILANIVHPNIAALLDGGYLGDGTPYLVMEYVEGREIDDYVFANNLSIADTLELFLQVCDAVQAAHQSLIVHRDIKPSNILVDNHGNSKLIDFGIAKDLAGVIGEVTELNNPAAITLDYASPEQYQRESITTATDVYALGVLLFKLLSGCKPYSLSNAGPVEIQRVIAEKPIPSMQARISEGELSQTLPLIKRAKIHEELELIVAKATAKEPHRRYATSQLFADDLRAHRRGSPVVARGDSLSYLAQKFVRRHWLGLGATTAVALAMVTALVISLAQTRSADQAAAHSNATSDFLAKLLLAPSSRADSPLRLGSDAKVSELLDHAAAELNGVGGDTFQGAPNVRAELMLTVARTYHGLAMYSQAIDLLQKARSICRSNDCARNFLSARIDFRLGQNLVLTGDPETALELFQSATVEDAKFALQAKIADETASALWSTGDQEGTVAKMEQSVRLYEAAAGETPDVLVAVSYTRLGSLYSNLGELDRGLELLDKGAALYEALHQNSLPELADLYNEISAIHWKRGNVSSSRDNLLLAHAVIERIDGVSEIEIRILTNLGLTPEEGRDRNPRYWLRKSQAALEQFTSADSVHEASAWVLHLEGRILSEEKRFNEALDLYRQELAIYEQLMPAYNDSHAGVDISMGIALEELGELEEALVHHQRVLDYYSKIYDEEETAYLARAKDRVASVSRRLEER